MRAIPLALACLLAACATPAIAPQAPAPAGPGVGLDLSDEALLIGELVRFLNAAQAGRFDEARTFLAASLRDRYSAERLKADFEIDPLAKERLSRARRAVGAKPVIDGPIARVPLDNGHHLRAVREDGGWKIAALEE